MRKVPWDIVLVVGAGGALGSLARWGVGVALPWNGSGFPWGTFVENVSGAFLLASLMVLLLEAVAPHRYLRPFLGTGVLGGYTTFSTSMLESRDLIAGERTPTAVLYIGGTLVAGLAAVWLGIVLARVLAGSARSRSRPRPARRTTTPRRSAR